MVLEKGDFQKKNDPKKKNRKATFIFFFGAVCLSTVFWLRPKTSSILKSFLKPATYHIVKPMGQEQNLAEVIGFQPDLQDKEGLLRSIDLLIEKLRGKYGIYVQNVSEDEGFGVNENEVFKAASVNKLPIMVAFYQQVEAKKINQDDEYSLKSKDIQDYGTGSLRYEKPGTVYSYSQLLDLIGKQSDNTAAFVLESLVGKKNVQNLVDKEDMENTSMEENATTPKEMGDFLLKLYNNQLLKEGNTKKVLDVLTKTDFEDRIPAGVPEGIKVAHKIGNEIQTYNDCGIVFGPNPYVLCILSSEAAEQEALDVLPKISRLVWEFESKI